MERTDGHPDADARGRQDSPAPRIGRTRLPPTPPPTYAAPTEAGARDPVLATLRDQTRTTEWGTEGDLMFIQIFGGCFRSSDTQRPDCSRGPRPLNALA